MSAADREKWDAKYGDRGVPAAAGADDWLMKSVVNLKPARALDIACGLGHNAIWLSRQGWEVDAVDVSPVGLKLAAESARRQAAIVHWLEADIETFEHRNTERATQRTPGFAVGGIFPSG